MTGRPLAAHIVRGRVMACPGRCSRLPRAEARVLGVPVLAELVR